ncbi:hypothetical protein BT69DRAFT_1279121 [Atractiella rhizophila]|nr:hypothetical protein BT69DRAFT_1279121 [Atractiella rhizophila]
MMDKVDTTKSRGFGFITFRELKDANDALALDGHNLDGRIIIVEWANPIQEKQK